MTLAETPRDAAGTATGEAPSWRAKVRMYRQGLGDCLYVELNRTDGEPFRILIDCGLVLGAPKKHPTIVNVMDDIVATLADKPLDLIVVTHPHWDHVSGFVKAPSFAKVATNAVWFGWPEDRSDPLARKLSSIHQTAEQTLRLGVVKLHGLQKTEEAAQIDSLLGFLGKNAATTRGAMAAVAAKVPPRARRYCRPDDPPFRVPGTNMRIYALGPPRTEAELRQMNPSRRDPETYSLTALSGLQNFAAAFQAGGETHDDSAPFDANFAIPRGHERTPEIFPHYFDPDNAWRAIESDWLQDMPTLTLLLDRAVNNSSLALAIELEPGGDVLLFAADAQVGNWKSWLKCQWTVDDALVTGPDLIARTIVYKVGHHASLNATLAADGVDRMDRLFAALVPVDAETAVKKRWGHNIPFGKLLSTLEEKSGGRVLRADEDWPGTHDSITRTDLAYEICL